MSIFAEEGLTGGGKQVEKQIMYCRWYLDNLAYLRELKEQFDIRIYSPLKSHLSTHHSSTNRPDTALSSTTHILEFKNSVPDIKDLYDDSDLENITGRLTYLRARLSHLLEDEGEIDADLFSVNSSMDSDDIKMDDERFIRLVPDILVKLSNASFLAKQWIDIAATKELDEDVKLIKLDRVKTILSDRLGSISSEIDSRQRELDEESGELKQLLKREERSDTISSQNQNLETKINRLNGKIDTFAKQVADIQDLIKTAAGNKQFTSQLNSELRKKKREKSELTRKLSVLEFEREIVVEDLCLELEIKPELIRQSSSLQEKCDSLESILLAMREEKQRLQDALEPVLEDESKANASP